MKRWHVTLVVLPLLVATLFLGCEHSTPPTQPNPEWALYAPTPSVVADDSVYFAWDWAKWWELIYGTHGAPPATFRITLNGPGGKKVIPSIVNEGGVLMSQYISLAPGKYSFFIEAMKFDEVLACSPEWQVNVK